MHRPIASNASWRSLFLRSALSGGALCIFLVRDWHSECVVLRDAVMIGIRGVDFQPLAINLRGSPAIQIDNHIYVITPRCAWIDLALVGVPLFWQRRRSFARNGIGTVAFLIIIFLVNLFRNIIAICLNVHGFNWNLVHNLPFVTAYFGILIYGVRRMLYDDAFQCSA